MKKGNKTRLSIGLSLLMCVSFGAVGCGGGGNVEEYELSSYKGDEMRDGKPYYNTSLFYSNDLQQGYADPLVLDNTAQDGYYYLYGTSNNFAAMRSKDLARWENVGPTFVKNDQGDKSDDVQKSAHTNMWAPEVVYDADTELYYLFFSATPKYADSEWNNADREQAGMVWNVEDTVTENDTQVTKHYMNSENGHPSYNMYVATSESPRGPFTMIDFTDENSCGAGKTHNYNTEVNVEITEAEAKSGDYAYVTKDGKYYKAAFPDPWAKFCMFSPDELSKVMQKNGIGANGGSSISTPDANYFATIDPHPYVDPVSEKKYMFFKAEDGSPTDSSSWNITIAVEMEDWLTPVWSTATYIAHSNYYTVNDWKNGQNRGVDYEGGYVCNEGPAILYHKDASGNDLYYYTFSVNNYTTSQYSVGMAVSKDGVLGPYRKLTEAEGGLLLCSLNTDSNTISGAGHHSFVTKDGRQYIAYHRHCDPSAPSAERYTSIDEVVFITVKDEDGNDLEVPYVNGPTDSVQPLPGYSNVAGKATVTCTDKEADVKYLTDGLLSVLKLADEDFMSYVGETEIKKTASINFAFDEAESIRAIMVYNSASYEKMFYNVSRIELTLENGDVRVIRDVKFDIDSYCEVSELSNEVNSIVSGAAAYAEFYDIKVKNVKLTVEVPEGQDAVSLSEIRILGSKAQ